MDLSKFINLIATEAVPFIRLDHFEEPYEGLPPLGNKISESDLQDLPEEHRAQEVIALNRNTKNLADLARQIVFVNCWHLNEHESAAMWRLYLSGSEGVAIRSSFGDLTGFIGPFRSRNSWRAALWNDRSTLIPAAKV